MENPSPPDPLDSASVPLLALPNQCFAATVAPKRLHCGHDVSARQRMGEPHLCPTLLAIGMDIFRGRYKNTRSQLVAILGQRRVGVSDAYHRGRSIPNGGRAPLEDFSVDKFERQLDGLQQRQLSIGH